VNVERSKLCLDLRSHSGDFRRHRHVGGVMQFTPNSIPMMALRFGLPATQPGGRVSSWQINVFRAPARKFEKKVSESA
jgi:hypothetical protein